MLITLNKIELDRTYFTADHHFGHANIIKFCNRPFPDAETMDNELVHRWNQAVTPTDVVFHLGDFTLGEVEQAGEYHQRLNGDMCILSNPWHHDKRWLSEIDTISHSIIVLPPMVVLEVPGLGQDGHPLAITLCHYPLEIWDRRHYGAIHLHAHSHGKAPSVPRRLDVGVDCHDYAPISLWRVMELLGVEHE